MDDPIFDPWCLDEARPTSSEESRWRSRSVAPLPRVPRATGSRRAVSGKGTTRARLPGLPGFLRTMAVPRLQEIAHRLVTSRHAAVLDDLLHGSPPVVMLTVRPWRGPLSDEPTPPIVGRFELSLPGDGDGRVSIRGWLGQDADEPLIQESVPADKLGAGWIEGSVMRFLDRVLSLA